MASACRPPPARGSRKGSVTSDQPEPIGSRRSPVTPFATEGVKVAASSAFEPTRYATTTLPPSSAERRQLRARLRGRGDPLPVARTGGALPTTASLCPQVRRGLLEHAGRGREAAFARPGDVEHAAREDPRVGDPDPAAVPLGRPAAGLRDDLPGEDGTREAAVGERPGRLTARVVEERPTLGDPPGVAVDPVEQAKARAVGAEDAAAFEMPAAARDEVVELVAVEGAEQAAGRPSPCRRELDEEADSPVERPPEARPRAVRPGHLDLVGVAQKRFGHGVWERSGSFRPPGVREAFSSAGTRRRSRGRTEDRPC